MTPEEIAERENISLKGLYNILSAMRKCPEKRWRQYTFTKTGKYWEGHMTELEEASGELSNATQA